MNAEPDESTEDRFTSLMAAWDDALAAEDETAGAGAAAVPPELRERLERDLALVRRLRHPHGVAPAATGAPADCPAQLGRFRILRELGRGGFGIVYLAHDEGLGRAVALKVPRADALGSPALRARFQQEAQAAAGLDHPNVVPVYDAGAVGPFCYIALAYCPGINLADWLKQRTEPVPYPLAAELVATLAGAVQHAHSRGVLHRDLKPSNVLLSAPPPEAEGSGPLPAVPDAGLGFVPRVTDFGLAKLTGGDAGQTQSGAILGTPSYMAPEQAAGKGKTIGPAADVYALGAILYELLTGRPPFQAETPLDTLVQVQTDEPVPPSRLRPRVPRDLETICLKCLHKEPPRRYARAGDLAEDLHRFLRGQPIRARPVGALGRLLRRCRRHPTVAGLLAALVLAILAGLAGVAWQWRQAVAERDEATRGWAEADRERARAEKSFRQALAAVDTYFTRVSEELLDEPGLQPLRKKLLDDALAYYQDFLRQRDGDPAVRAELVKAHYRVAQITAMIGPKTEALPLFQKALLLQRQLVRDNPGARDAQRGLASVCHLLGNLQSTLERPDAALDSYAEARAIHDEHLGLHLDDYYNRFTLGALWQHIGGALHSLGRRDEALAAYRQAVAHQRAALREKPNSLFSREALSRHLSALAWLRYQSGALANAARGYQESLELLNQLRRERPAALGVRADQGAVYSRLAVLQMSTGEHDKALQNQRQARALREELARSNPDVPLFRSDLAVSCLRLGYLYFQAGQPGEAQRSFAEAHALCVQLTRDQPTDSEYLYQLAQSHCGFGALRQSERKPSEAIAAFQPALSLLRRLARDYPGNTAYQNKLADTSDRIGLLHSTLGQPAQALGFLQRARESYDRLLHREPENVFLRSDTGNNLHNLAQALALLGRNEEAQKAFEQAVEHQRRAYEKAPQVTRFRVALIRHHGDLALLHKKLGRPADAVPLMRQAASLQEQVVRQMPKDSFARSQLGAIANDLGNVLMLVERDEEALATFRRAIENQRIAFAQAPQVLRYRQFLSSHYRNLARVQRKLGRPEEAVAATRENRQLWPDSPNRLCEVAWDLALCIPLVGRGKKDLTAEEEDRRRGLGDEAMKVLRQAVARGFRNSDLLTREPAFAALRAREDFRQLLSELREKAK